MKTKEIIKQQLAGYEGYVYVIVTIPKGTDVKPATNQPGNQYWVQAWEGIGKLHLELIDGVGILIGADEVEENES